MPRLSIDVANAAGARKRSTSATGSEDSDFFDEGMDDLDEDLDKPWVKPSLDQAKNVRKVSLEPSATDGKGEGGGGVRVYGLQSIPHT